MKAHAYEHSGEQRLISQSINHELSAWRHFWMLLREKHMNSVRKTRLFNKKFYPKLNEPKPN